MCHDSIKARGVVKFCFIFETHLTILLMAPWAPTNESPLTIVIVEAATGLYGLDATV